MILFNQKKGCCGCGLCKAACKLKAIYWETDNEGFKYPKIDEKICVNCGLCEEVCIFKNREGNNTTSFVFPTYYAGKHIDDSVRITSSSGGAFTAISDYILENDGIVSGAILDSKKEVIHITASNKKERDRMKGSKYVQSDMGNIFDDVVSNLRLDKYVLFSGTPCQVSSMKRYVEIKEPLGLKKLLLCDVICHGVSSPKLWRDYIHKIENDNGKIINYYFRSKKAGWHTISEMVEFSNNGKKIKCDSNSYLRIFFKDVALRPACHNCKFSTKDRTSDITIADFWGIEKKMPELDDNKGISLLIVNTEKGRSVLKSIKNSLQLWEIVPDFASQPNLISPTPTPNKRDTFWKDYNSRGYIFIFNKYIKLSYKEKIKFLIIKALRKSNMLEIAVKVRHYFN